MTECYARGVEKLTTEQRTKAIDILYHYGERPQMIKCCEELSELESAILKYINKGSNNLDDVLDEIADVYIMLEQMKIAFMLGEEAISKRIDFKLDRQAKRIKGNEE